MKKGIAFIMVVLTVGLLFGCTGKQTSVNELWVVTEATTWDRMNGQVAAVEEQFEKDHEGISLRVDVLPTDDQERSVYIQQLRTQILRGGGPDVYLLPTSTQLLVDIPIGYTAITVEPLFSDVVQAMENGMFRDISSLYDADTQLGKESLKTSVMNAGVVDGKRYVLPLRYDIPVIYADADAMAQHGFTGEDLTKNIDALLTQVHNGKDPVIAGAFTRLSTEVFSGWMDYDEQTVELDADTIAAFLYSYQANQALQANSSRYVSMMDVRDYCWSGALEQFRQLYVGSLSELVEYAPVYQYEGRELAVLPMHAIGGDVVAQVTYYGAVGSGCDDIELAYAFLRTFLLEESQWEINRPQTLNAVGEKGRKVSTTNTTQVEGLIEEGWPVRIQGSVNSLWTVRKRQFYDHKVRIGDPETAKRMRAVAMSQMDDAWEQILATEPDQVRFGGSMDSAFRDLLTTLNDPETKAPENVDINALAESFWWQLRWHVAEG